MTGLDRLTAARAALGVAMLAASVLILAAGAGLTFAGDELFYYAHLVPEGYGTVPTFGLEYLLAPHNDHLVVFGRVFYDVMLSVFGTDYTAFRVAALAGILVCVGLFFSLARRAVDPWLAVALCLSLLFLGYANEAQLWAFDIHTVYSLGFGLGAVLALRREDRLGDALACALLVLSTATIELGLCFAVGAAVAVLARPGGWRRAWIFLTPVVLYGAWWLWAAKFEQSAGGLHNIELISTHIPDALAAVTGSVLGVNPTGAEIPPELTTVTTWGVVAAAAAVALLVWRISRGNVPLGLWVALAVLISYWLTVAFGGRAPDSSRYIFPGTLLTFLVAVEALRGIRIPTAAILAAFAVFAVALPANVAKTYDGRDQRLFGAELTETEYTMLELAGPERAQPGYVPAADPNVIERGGGLGIALSAGDYFRAAEEYGPLSTSLAEIRGADLGMRNAADATLAGALGIRLAPAAPPPGGEECPGIREASPDDVAFFDLSPGTVLLGSQEQRPVAVSIAHFGRGGPGVSVGELAPGEWGELRIPGVRGVEAWSAIVDGRVLVCEA